MKAKKITFTVNIEVFHIDSVGALLISVIDAMESGKEFESGSLYASDGDCVVWSSTETILEI